MLKPLLIGFVIGFAAIGFDWAGKLPQPRLALVRTPTLSLGSPAAFARGLVRDCRPRPAYPGLA